MLVRVFKSNQKIVNGLVILLTTLLSIPIFLREDYNAETSIFSTGFFWIDAIIFIIIVSFQAIYINIIVNDYKIIGNNSHLTSLVFVVLNFFFIQLFTLNQVIIANSFILLGLHQLLKVYDAKGGFGFSFNAGFLISIATVIYLPNFVFLLLLWGGLVYLFTPKWRDFIISLIGFSIPLIYVICYNYVFGDLAGIDLSDYKQNIFNLSLENLSFLAKVLFLIFLGLVVFSFLKISTSLDRGALRARKMMIVIMLMIAVGLGALFLNNTDYLATFIVLTIPFSILIANFFQHMKKQWLAELLFMSLFLAVIANYFS